MNYQAELEKILKSIEDKYQIGDKIAIKPKLLLHACCGPCSSYVLEYLNRFFDITIFYYNPNIHPEAEYTRRLEELEEFLPKFSKNFENPNINLIKDEYNPEVFYSAIKIKENPKLAKEKEKGMRCYRCYEFLLVGLWVVLCFQVECVFVELVLLLVGFVVVHALLLVEMCLHHHYYYYHCLFDLVLFPLIYYFLHFHYSYYL